MTSTFSYVSLQNRFIYNRRITVNSKMMYRSGTVNSNTVNSKFHLIRSYYEIFFYHFSNISCLKCTVNSNFHLIRSKTLPTNDFELTVPNLYHESLDNSEKWTILELNKIQEQDVTLCHDEQANNINWYTTSNQTVKLIINLQQWFSAIAILRSQQLFIASWKRSGFKISTIRQQKNTEMTYQFEYSRLLPIDCVEEKWKRSSKFFRMVLISLKFLHAT